MTRNYKIFIGLVVLGTVAFMVVADALSHVKNSAANTIGSWLWLILFLWVVFDLVSRLIYRLVGVTSKLPLRGALPRPTHQQAAEMNKYWITWLGCAFTTVILYTFVLDPQEWKSIIPTALVGVVIVSLSIINSKRKIAGHHKKDLFQ